MRNRKLRRAIRNWAPTAAIVTLVFCGTGFDYLQHSRQQEELDRRGVWMQSVDGNIKQMLERHEAEDLVRKPEDVPDRFTGSQADKLIRRIEALEQRVGAMDD